MNRVRIGSWLAIPDLNTLFCEEIEVRIEPKNMQLLLLLAENAGEVVTKELIHREVWEDTFVTDGTVWHAISDLRQVLAQDRSSQDYIETVPKIGYLLKAPVALEDEQSKATLMDPGNLEIAGSFTWSSAGVIGISICLIAFSYVLWSLLDRPTDRDKSSSKLSRLTSTGEAYSPAISADGTRLAYSGGAEVWVADFNGEDPIRVYGERGNFLPLLDTGAFLYVAQGPMIKRFDLQDPGSPEDVGVIPPGLRVNDLNSRGDQIAYTSVEYETDVWLLGYSSERYAEPH